MTFKLLFVICAIAVTVDLAKVQQQKVQVSTRYITTNVTTIGQHETLIFVASLCQQFVGHSVEATVLLNNNPTWQTHKGVIYFYIVEDPNKHENESLCTNNSTRGVEPNCSIPAWRKPTDLYLKAEAGNVAAISFSVEVKMQSAKKGGRMKNSSLAKRYHGHDLKKNTSANLHLKAGVVYLSEIVSVETNQRLEYLGQDILDVTFCPNSVTTNEYKITSTVFATDGGSSYAQYVCDKLPCEVDGANELKQSNGKQLPANNVILTTASNQYSRIYVLIVCWAGPFDPTVQDYVGHYQYSGSISRSP